MSGDPTPGRPPVSPEPVVEYCLRNVSKQSREMLEGSGLPVEGTACLGRCGDCFAEEYLVVDGEYVPGSHEELIGALGGRS